MYRFLDKDSKEKEVKICVDPPKKKPTKPFKSCHMFVVDGSQEFLEIFAMSMGLKLEWKHGDHFDLDWDQREKAIRLGAVTVGFDSKEMKQFLGNRTKTR